MSKGLKALEKICKQACDDRDKLFYLNDLDCKKTKENEAYFPYCDGCLYCSGNENYKTIEKELKALEIVKEKRIHVLFLSYSFTLEEISKDGIEYYNNHFGNEDFHLTKEEYDLLKEVL